MLRRDGSFAFVGFRRIVPADIDALRGRIAEALRAGRRDIVIDLSRTEVIDPAALDALKQLTFDIAQSPGESPTTLAFEHVSEALERVLKDAKFDHVFRISRGANEIKRTTPEVPV